MMRFKTKYKLYEWINKHPRCLFMQIVKAMGWSIKKTSKYLRALEKDGLVETKYEEMDDEYNVWGEKTFYYYATSYKKLLNNPLSSSWLRIPDLQSGEVGSNPASGSQKCQKKREIY